MSRTLKCSKNINPPKGLITVTYNYRKTKLTGVPSMLSAIMLRAKRTCMNPSDELIEFHFPAFNHLSTTLLYFHCDL